MHLSTPRYPVKLFLANSDIYCRQPGEIFGTVYALANFIDDKLYIGSTKNIGERARQYIRGYHNKTQLIKST